jgi:hypothetical protein
MKYEDWIEKYKLITREDGGEMWFDTDEDHLMVVKDVFRKSPLRVWTILKGDMRDDGNLYIINGLHSTRNRIGYFLTENICDQESLRIEF